MKMSNETFDLNKSRHKSKGPLMKIKMNLMPKRNECTNAV